MNKLLLLSCLLLVTACTLQTEIVSTSPASTTPMAISSPLVTPEENDHVYTTKDFSLTYLPEYSIQSDTESEVIWQAEFNTGEVRSNQISLKSQTKPFVAIKAGAPLNMGEMSGTVDGVEEETTITVDGKQIKRYTYGCGVDCYYGTIRFQVGNTYYELTQNIAGGGLSRRFDTLVNSIKFK